MSEHMPPWEANELEYDYDESEQDLTCPVCAGTGGDPWNDGILPCEHCDGEGYLWYLA